MVKEEFHIRLEAKNPEKGHLRAYRIDAGQDLFGQWHIEVTMRPLPPLSGIACTAGPARPSGSASPIRSGSCAIPKNGLVFVFRDRRKTRPEDSPTNLESDIRFHDAVGPD